MMSHKLPGRSSTLCPQRPPVFTFSYSIALRILASCFTGWNMAPFALGIITPFKTRMRKKGVTVCICAQQTSLTSNWQIFIELSCVWQCIRLWNLMINKKLDIPGPLANPADPNMGLLREFPFSPYTRLALHRAGSFSNPCPLTAIPLSLSGKFCELS